MDQDNLVAHVARTAHPGQDRTTLPIQTHAMSQSQKSRLVEYVFRNLKEFSALIAHLALTAYQGQDRKRPCLYSRNLRSPALCNASSGIKKVRCTDRTGSPRGLVERIFMHRKKLLCTDRACSPHGPSRARKKRPCLYKSMPCRNLSPALWNAPSGITKQSGYVALGNRSAALKR